MKRGAWLWLVLAATQVADAAELGRLFFSPAERDALDRIRHAVPAPLPPPAASVPASGAAVAEAPSMPAVPLTVDGYILRSGGAPTVWINGEDATAGALDDLGIEGGALALERAAVRVPAAPERKGVLLKPGQSFDPESNKVTDAYERPPAP